MTVYRVGRRWTASDEETLLERNKRIAELEAELDEVRTVAEAVRTVAEASEQNHAIQFDRVVAEKHELEAELANERKKVIWLEGTSEWSDVLKERARAEKAEAEVERLKPYEAHVLSHDDVCCRCMYEGGGRESGDLPLCVCGNRHIGPCPPED